MARFVFSGKATRSLRRLDAQKRDAVRDAFRKFALDERHPGLNFEALSGHEDLFSIRITRGDRAILRRQVDEAGEFYEVMRIGSHDIYRELGR